MRDSGVTIHDLLAHRAWVQALASSLVRGQSDADDIEQATWVAALERPPAHRGNLRAWLGRVVRRRHSDTMRSEARRVNRESTARPPDAQGLPESMLIRGELRARLAQEVLRLDEPYRSTVLLRFFEGLEPSEIARIQGAPVETVRTRQRRALQQLRARLAGPEGDLRSVLAPILAPSSFGLGQSGAHIVMAATTTTKLWVTSLAGLALVAALFAWITFDTDDAPSGDGSSISTQAGEPSRGDSPGAPTLTVNTQALEGSPSTTAAHGTGGRWVVRAGASVRPDEIVGVVTDERGRPLSRVAAILESGGEDGEPETRITGSDGHFHFGGVGDQARTLVLNYGAASMRRRVFAGSRTIEVTLTIDVPLPKGVKVERRADRGELGGTVSDAQGVALPGCEVRLLDEVGRDTLQGRVTNEAGEFKFVNLDEGVYALLFVADTTRLFARARAGQWLSVALRTPLSLSGVVVAAETGEPIAGVPVEAIGAGAPDSPRRTMTDEQGAFSFTVPAGDWRIVAGKARRTQGDRVSEEFLPAQIGPVAAGGAEHRIALIRGGEIAGELRGPTGASWTSGAVVRATPTTREGAIDHSGVRLARALEDGTFRIVGLSGAVCDLSVASTHDGLTVFAHQAQVPVGTTGMIVDLIEGQPITVKLADARGDPVEVTGGWIYVAPAGSAPGASKSVGARRREDGVYETPALDPSLSYVVTAGGFRGYVPGQTTRVRAGDGDVTVRLGGVRFSGRLLDAEGEPVPHARIEAWAVGADIPTHAWTETDAEGAFVIPGAPPGEVKIAAVVAGKRVPLGTYDSPADAATLRLP